MKTATVIWTDGKSETVAVIRETETQFVTGDVNQCRWWKQTGLRVGTMRYVKKSLRGRSWYESASARIN